MTAFAYTRNPVLAGGPVAPGEKPGTGKMYGSHFSECSFELVIPKREVVHEMHKRLKKLSSSDRNLSEEDKVWLLRLTEKTTNRARATVLTSTDPRGPRGLLDHAQLNDFPDHLIIYMYVRNKDIRALARV